LSDHHGLIRWLRDRRSDSREWLGALKSACASRNTEKAENDGQPEDNCDKSARIQYGTIWHTVVAVNFVGTRRCRMT
jgi:hypothetical protein